MARAAGNHHRIDLLSNFLVECLAMEEEHGYDCHHLEQKEYKVAEVSEHLHLTDYVAVVAETEAQEHAREVNADQDSKEDLNLFLLMLHSLRTIFFEICSHPEVIKRDANEKWDEKDQIH